MQGFHFLPRLRSNHDKLDYAANVPRSLVFQELAAKGDGDGF